MVLKLQPEEHTEYTEAFAEDMIIKKQIMGKIIFSVTGFIYLIGEFA